MEYKVKMSGGAQRDLVRIVAWLAGRSLDGAIGLERAFSATLERIAEAPLSFGFATDDEFELLEVRQAFFKTRRGKLHRALFAISGSEVWILHVRGPGQNLLTDIVPPSPPNDNS